MEAAAMSKLIRTILATVMGITALSVSAGAYAHDRDRHGRHQGHGWGQYKHHHHDHRRYSYKVIRERVVIHQPPPVYYERRAHYGPPAIVIGVDVPPLVVRLR